MNSRYASKYTCVLLSGPNGPPWHYQCIFIYLSVVNLLTNKAWLLLLRDLLIVPDSCVTLCLLGKFSCCFDVCWFFFKKFFYWYHKSAWSGSKLFASVIRQSVLEAEIGVYRATLTLSATLSNPRMPNMIQDFYRLFFSKFRPVFSKFHPVLLRHNFTLP